jgi:hypothetical protein
MSILFSYEPVSNMVRFVAKIYVANECSTLALYYFECVVLPLASASASPTSNAPIASRCVNSSFDIHLRSNAAAAASATSTSQEDNDWLSAELHDRHTKIPNLVVSYRSMDLEAAAALPNFSQLFLFVSRVRNCSGEMHISYLVVPKRKGDLDTVGFVVCFPDWKKNRHLLQLNLISSQSTENNKVYSAL